MILLVIILFIFGLYVTQRYRWLTVLARNGIPGPLPSFLSGNLFDYMNSANVPKISEYFAKYGPVMGFYMGSRPVVLINDIELARRIQIKDFAKFSDRQKSGLKYGLTPNPKYFHNILSAEGSHWKQLRSIMNPTFSAMKLKTMTPIIDSCIDILLAKVEDHSKADKEFDIYMDFQLFTMDVITKCALGMDINVQANPDDEFLKAVKRAFDAPSRLVTFFICFSELDFFLYPLRRAMQMYKEWRGLSASDTLAKLVQAAIKDRVNKSTPKQQDMLQMLLDAKMTQDQIENTKALNLTIDLNRSEQNDEVVQDSKFLTNSQSRSIKSLTHGEIVSTALVFYEAGAETNGSTLGFIAHVLVNNQDIQEKVREEVIELYQEEGTFDYNTMTKLPYMHCVINETMRLYPPMATFVTRTANSDYAYNGMTIPKGASVRIPTHQLHHNELYWPEHEHFDPDRFRDKSTVDSVAFQPFGTGPRNCIGMRFALYEIKLVLAKLLFKYRLVPGLSTEKELTVDYKFFTQSPKHGVFVRAIPLEFVN